MPNLNVRLISLLETLDCRLCFGRPLAFHDISSLRDDETSVVEALKMLAKDKFEEISRALLYQHSLPETPKLGTFSLRLDPPRGLNPSGSSDLVR